VTPTCEKCNSVVKPDIVFFGENLPKRFYENVTADFNDCNLVTLSLTTFIIEGIKKLEPCTTSDICNYERI
jgi:NAD-dependent SIR2 family protein deacetylase